MKEVSKRYSYQVMKNGHFVRGSFYSVKGMLDFIKQHPDITEVVEHVYLYKETGICSKGQEKVIPLGEIAQLKQVSYQLVMPQNVVLNEEIFHFTGALAIAKEIKAEGLLETTKFFDIHGNEIVSESPRKPWSAYLLRGDIILSEELPQKISQLGNKAIYLQKPNPELADKQSLCIVTKSGVVGFVGRYVKPLNAYIH